MRRKTVRVARERMGCLAFVEAYRLGENPEVAAVDSSLYEKTKGTDSAKTARRFLWHMNYFAGLGAVGRTYDAARFHFFHQAGRAVVADF